MKINKRKGDFSMSDDIKDEVLDADVTVEDVQKEEKKKKKKLSKEQEELEKLKEEFEAYKASHLRVLAEYDNFRKRSISEKTQIYSSAVSDTVNSILPVADNIERAALQENASAEDMRKGVEMIMNQFKICFEKIGIEAVGEVGEDFNPDLHNAVSHIESDELKENTIAAVFQKGYKLGDKVVRHAVVQVAN